MTPVRSGHRAGLSKDLETGTRTVTCWYKNLKSEFVPGRDRSGPKTLSTSTKMWKYMVWRFSLKMSLPENYIEIFLHRRCNFTHLTLSHSIMKNDLFVFTPVIFKKPVKTIRYNRVKVVVLDATWSNVLFRQQSKSCIRSSVWCWTIPRVNQEPDLPARVAPIHTYLFMCCSK